MSISSFQDYLNSLPMLTKIEYKAEVDPNNGEFVITETKETYVYDNEEDADKRIDAVRQDLGFISVVKKYKAGKMDKAGEVVKPETWTVVAKLTH